MNSCARTSYTITSIWWLLLGKYLELCSSSPATDIGTSLIQALFLPLLLSMQKAPSGKISRNSLAREEAAHFRSRSEIRRSPLGHLGHLDSPTDDDYQPDTIPRELKPNIRKTPRAPPRGISDTTKTPRTQQPRKKYKIAAEAPETPTPLARAVEQPVTSPVTRGTEYPETPSFYQTLRDRAARAFAVTLPDTVNTTPPVLPEAESVTFAHGDNVPQLPGIFPMDATATPQPPQDVNHFSDAQFSMIRAIIVDAMRSETATLREAVGEMQDRMDTLGSEVASLLPAANPCFTRPAPHLRGGQDPEPTPAIDKNQHERNESRERRRDDNRKDYRERRGRDRERERDRYYTESRHERQQGDCIKPKEVGEFNGEGVEFFIKSVELMATIYGESQVCGVLPKCMKGAARDWLASMPAAEIRYMRSVDQWVFVLREEFGDSTRRLRDEAEARFFDPDKESSDAYCFDKMGLHRRAQPDITLDDLLLELWRGLEKKAIDCQVMSWRQPSTRDFREELRQRSETMQKARKLKKISWTTKPQARGDSSWSSRNATRSSRNKKDSASAPKRKPSDKGHGMCICGGDHYRNDCPETKKSSDKKTAADKPDDKSKKKKTYTSKAQNADSDDLDSSATTVSDSEYESSDDERQHANFTVVKRCLLSFSHSTSTNSADVSVIEIPKAPSMGDGLSWLNGDPMPVEVWFGDVGDTPRKSVTGCADSGGQCLIQESILKLHVPDAVIVRNGRMKPTFQGIGGATEHPLGHILLPILLPDALALAGKSGGKAARLWLEFQVVKKLDCNFLIGREAMKAYSLDIVESLGHIKVGTVEVPIADHGGAKRSLKQMNCSVVASSAVVVPAGSSAVIPIAFATSVPQHKDLLFTPKNVCDLSRELRGVMPSMLVRNTTSFIPFDNVCRYPIRVEKGQALGAISIIKSGSKMTMFAAASTSFDRAPERSAVRHQPVLPPAFDPWTRNANVSRLDHLWSNLMGSESSKRSGDVFSEHWCLMSEKNAKESRPRKWRLDQDGEILRYTDTWQGRKIRNDIAERNGSTTEATPVGRRMRRLMEKKLQVVKKDSLNVMSAVVDPDGLPVAPLGLETEVDPEDRVIDMIELKIANEFRPGTLFDSLKIAVDKALSQEMRKQLCSVLKRFASCFSFEGRRLGDVDMPPMAIEVLKTPSSKTHAYKESPRTAKNIKSAVAQLKAMDIIEPSSAPIASPVVMIKQNDKWRFCVDFRAVNELTPLDKYPIPRPDAVFAALSGAQFFSTMDANKGYHQFRLAEESRWLTSFITEREGIWQYKRVPFGLQNAPAFFQRSIDSLLGRYRWQFALAYIDDIVVWSKTWPEHLTHIGKILSAFSRVGLTLDERKCNWGFAAVDLLGLRVNRLGLRTLESKTRAVRELPFPKTMKQLRQILGQFSYYRQFMRNFAMIAEPLTTALKFKEERPAGSQPKTPAEIRSAARAAGRRPVEMTAARIEALNQLKKFLSEAPVLRYPDFLKAFYLYTDASGRGLGGALHQEFDGVQRPILFISRTLTPAEKNYSATELECLAVYWSFSKLSHYIDGCKGLTVVTDHHALQWLWNVKQATNSRLHRWAMLLAPFKSKIKVVHRAGTAHSNVDPLSRFPVHPTPTAHSMVSSLIPEGWENIASLYESDEFFAGHYNDTIATGGSLDSSVTAFKQLGRASTEDVSPTVVPSVTAEQLGRTRTTVTGSNEVETVPSETAKQLGRVSTEILASRHGQNEVADNSEVPTSEHLGQPTEESGKQKVTEHKQFVKDADNLLWRLDMDGKRTLCVPEGKRLDILNVIHKNLIHPGFARCLAFARDRYFWPSLRKDVESCCHSCHVCQMVKTDTSKKPGSLNPIPTPPPLHTLCIDFVEAMPPCKGCNSLATITDKSTKAVALIPCKKSTTAMEFASLFFNKVYPCWGVPQKIISDRDRRFVSAFWATLMEKAGTKVALTTAYHPQSDGQSERTNRTIKAMLRLLVIEKPEIPWVEMLPSIELAHNSTPHTTTGFSPYKLLYAVAPKTFGEMSAP